MYNDSQSDSEFEDNRSNFNREILKNLVHIPSKDLLSQEFIGRGSFGSVCQGKWISKGLLVALKKLIDPIEFEKEAFELSKVNHENIIKIYGYSQNNILILELAEGGSLHTLLHSKRLKNTTYTLSHALSWLLQCARGVEYLHSYKPKPILHRDLKPLNLLLTDHFRTIKICDFGLARSKQTIMSKNKGTPSYMAPEIIRNERYTEKCDVFSFGIILWEVLARQFPFFHMDYYALIYAICHNKRPQKLKNCPTMLWNLMENCWDDQHPNRPSMSEVVSIMIKLFSFCNEEAKHPIVIVEESDEHYSYNSFTNLTDGSAIGNSSNNAFYSENNINICNSSNLDTTDECDHRQANCHDAHCITPTNANDFQTEVDDLLSTFPAYKLLEKNLIIPQSYINSSELASLKEVYLKLSQKYVRIRFENELLENYMKELKSGQLDKNVLFNNYLDENQNMKRLLDDLVKSLQQKLNANSHHTDSGQLM